MQSKIGIFHSLSKEIKESLLIVAREDAPSQRLIDQTSLSKQRAHKRRKEELLLEHNMNKASEKYIDALYYHEMFHSVACWKTKKDVNSQLKRLKSKTAKMSALKENIRMRVIGLGWKDLATPWSKNGVEFTSNELMNHLKLIIEQERTRIIPSKFQPDISKRKDLPQLGTRIMNIQDFDINRQSNTQSFEKNAMNVRNEREALGFGDRYTEMQPTSRPNIDIHLLGKRLEICEK